MKRIGFDRASGTLVVMGGEVYPPCALSATSDDAGMIRIVSAAERVEVYEHWTQIAPLGADEAFRFADAAEALAYLRAEFRRSLAPESPTWWAARPLSAPRAVRDVGTGGLDYASAREVEHRDAVLGLTATACESGLAVDLVTVGPVTSAGWGLTPGRPILLGDDGLIVQDAPDGARFLLRLGFAVEPDTAVVRIGPAITLL